MPISVFASPETPREHGFVGTGLDLLQSAQGSRTTVETP